MAITYETLFEILRREKNHDDLQALEATFFQDVKQYLGDKLTRLVEKPRLDQFTEGHEQEQAALRTQVNNIRRIIRDIFDRRERKILEMAVNKAKTGSDIIDTSALLPEEEAFFDEQVRTIGSFRDSLLHTALGIRMASKQAETAPESPPEPKGLNMAHSEADMNELKKVHILEDVPKFVGLDLEIYGPFSTSDEVALHPEIADMLVKANKAKPVE